MLGGAPYLSGVGEGGGGGVVGGHLQLQRAGSGAQLLLCLLDAGFDDAHLAGAPPRRSNTWPAATAPGLEAGMLVRSGSRRKLPPPAAGALTMLSVEAPFTGTQLN